MAYIRHDENNTPDNPQPGKTTVNQFSSNQGWTTVTYENFNADYQARNDDNSARTPGTYQARNDDNTARTPAVYIRHDETNLPKPALDLRFALNKSLTDHISGNNLITFTRASSATYVGADGLIKTAAADEARFDHDPATGESLGLLIEESRTNRLPYSEKFDEWTIGGAATVTPNAVVAPDGTLTADRVLLSQSGGGSQINQPNVVQTNVEYTASVWAKAVTPGSEDTFRIIIGGRQSPTFTATGEWQRFTVTGSTGTPGLLQIKNHNSSITAADIYFWGAQLEPGSFVTSYIPTDGSAVTRAADVTEITGTNFSSFYNQTEGTFFTHTGVRSVDNTTADTARVILFSGPNTNNAHWLEYRDSNSNINTRSKSGGSNYYDTVASLTPINYLNDKVSISYSATGGAAAIDGVIKTNSSLEFTPTPVSLTIGQRSSSRFINGHIKRLAYMSGRLPDTILQSMTS